MPRRDRGPLRAGRLSPPCHIGQRRTTDPTRARGPCRVGVSVAPRSGTRRSRVGRWGSTTGRRSRRRARAGRPRAARAGRQPDRGRGAAVGRATVAVLAERCLPAVTEAAPESFTELVATAIANSEARAELRRLAEEQAALRRVATLVAHGVPPAELFAAVTEEVARRPRADVAGMTRFEPDGAQTLVAAWPRAPDHLRVGTRMPMFEGVDAAPGARGRAAGRASTTARPRPARSPRWSAGSACAASVGGPITSRGALWGAMIVDRRGRALPGRTEHRLDEFTELVATAIANARRGRAAAARRGAGGAAAGRDARRARGRRRTDLFAAVAAEVGARRSPRTSRACSATSPTGRRRSSRAGAIGRAAPVGARLALEGDSVAARVHRTRPAGADGQLRRRARAVRATLRRQLGIRSAVGAPIVVDGRLWGVMIAGRTAPTRSRPTPRRGSASSPSWSRPRSPTPTAGPSWPRRAPGSSRRPTTRAGASSATCTTARSSGSCRWRSSCACSSRLARRDEDAARRARRGDRA